MSQRANEGDMRAVPPMVDAPGCWVCDGPLECGAPPAAPVCGRCVRWPRPLLDAHLDAGDESRERVKVRLIALGNNQYEFRACRIDGEWLEVADTRHDLTFWVARDHIVTVWEERV